MPKELTMLNAANLCPSSGPVLETMYRLTKDMDQDPSQDNRNKLADGRETTRKLLAEFLRVTPEDIVITRNTSESNNLVSTGIELKAGDEVLPTAGQPSERATWPPAGAGKGEAVRLPLTLRQGRADAEPSPRGDGCTTSMRSPRRSRRGPG